MKVSNTSIIKSNSVESAIVASLKESYSKEWVAKFTEGVVVDGSVGAYIDTDEKDAYTSVTTNYFIATEIGGGLYRVEHCSESEMKWKI